MTKICPEQPHTSRTQCGGVEGRGSRAGGRGEGARFSLVPTAPHGNMEVQAPAGRAALESRLARPGPPSLRPMCRNAEHLPGHVTTPTGEETFPACKPTKCGVRAERKQAWRGLPVRMGVARETCPQHPLLLSLGCLK